jgi:hypothetical protein
MLPTMKRTILLCLGIICLLALGGLYYYNNFKTQSLEGRWVKMEGKKSACPSFLTFKGESQLTMSGFGPESNMFMTGNLAKIGENKYKYVVEIMSEVDSAELRINKLEDNILDINIDKDRCSYVKDQK